MKRNVLMLLVVLFVLAGFSSVTAQEPTPTPWYADLLRYAVRVMPTPTNTPTPTPTSAPPPQSQSQSVQSQSAPLPDLTCHYDVHHGTKLRLMCDVIKVHPDGSVDANEGYIVPWTVGCKRPVYVQCN